MIFFAPVSVCMAMETSWFNPTRVFGLQEYLLIDFSKATGVFLSSSWLTLYQFENFTLQMMIALCLSQLPEYENP